MQGMGCRGIGLVLALAISMPALAQGDEGTRYAVLDVRGVGKVESSQVEGLSALLASEIDRRPEVSVVRSAEINTMIGFEAQKQLLGCDDGGCLAEIGGALGVAFLVQTEVTQIGETYLLSLVLLDVEEARATRRVTREVPNESKLIASLREAVAELMMDVATAGGATASPELLAGPRKRSSPLKWIGLGLGGAAAVTGGILYGGSLGTYFHAKRAPAEVTRDQRDSAEARYPLGLGLLGGGVALAVAALLLPSGGGNTTVVLLPMPDGAMVGLSFQFDGPENSNR